MSPVQTRYIWETFWQNSFAFERCYFRNTLGSASWVSKKPCVDFWHVVAKPGPCLSPVCKFPVTPLPSALQLLLEMPAHLWGCCRARNLRNPSSVALRGSQNWRVADPKGSGAWALCQWVWISPSRWGVSSFVWVKLGYGSIVQQERRTPVAAFSFGK